VSGLKRAGTGHYQLFPAPENKKQKRLDEAFDKIREKYGHDVLKRGKS